MRANKLVILAVGIIAVVAVLLVGGSLFLREAIRLFDDGFGVEMLEPVAQGDVSADATVSGSVDPARSGSGAATTGDLAPQRFAVQVPAGETVHVLLASEWGYLPDLDELQPRVRHQGSAPEALRRERVNLTVETSVSAQGLFYLKSDVPQTVQLVWENPVEGFFLARSGPILVPMANLAFYGFGTMGVATLIVVVLVVLLLRKPKVNPPLVPGGAGRPGSAGRFDRHRR
ncbi:MAG: hypothetical protein ACFB20_10340 [Opitutales bacterium]